MPSVFILSDDYKTILNPEAAKLCIHLSQVSDKVLLYIILSEDYTYGPYRRKPKLERQELARRFVWGKKLPDMDKISHLQKACDEYDSLIFDTLKFKRDTYLVKLVQLGKSFEAEEDPNRMTQIMKAIDTVEQRLKDIDVEIDRSEERIELAGDRTLSLIEKFIRNRKEYKKLMHS